MIVLHLIHIEYSWSLVMLSLFCLMTKRRIAPNPSHRYYSLALRYRESSDAVGAVSPAPSSEPASAADPQPQTILRNACKTKYDLAMVTRCQRRRRGVVAPPRAPRCP